VVTTTAAAVIPSGLTVGNGRAAGGAGVHNSGNLRRRANTQKIFCQPLPSGVWDACASAQPAVAGQRDFPKAGFDAIASSG